jgi:hypothetical protein
MPSDKKKTWEGSFINVAKVSAVYHMCLMNHNLIPNDNFSTEKKLFSAMEIRRYIVAGSDESGREIFLFVLRDFAYTSKYLKMCDTCAQRALALKITQQAN